MKTAATMFLGLFLVCDVGQACGLCHKTRHRRVAAMCRVQPVPHYAPSLPMAPAYAMASPTVYAMSPQSEVVLTSGVAPAPAATALPAAPVAMPTAAVEPRYEYQVAGGQPAYYYSVDNSGKLIVRQWMDYLFRGGREAGMPTPPPPIIGRLRQN